MVALIYGANFSIAKIVLNGGYIQPLGFILIRVFSGFLFFQIVHRLWIKESIRREDLGLFVLCGLFGVAINQMFFFSGLVRTTPIHASLIMTTTPILVLLISALVIGERITLQKLLGILIGGAGAFLLIGYGKEVGFSKEQALGDIMILINASSYGIYLVLVKKLMRRYNALTVVMWVFSFGLVFVFPFGISEFLAIDWSTFDTKIWLVVVYVIVFVTFLTYLFNAYALKIVNPSVVSIYIYLQPLFASFIALTFFGESLSFIKIIAALLIFTGVFLVSKKSS